MRGLATFKDRGDLYMIKRSSCYFSKFEAPIFYFLCKLTFLDVGGVCEDIGALFKD